MDCETEETMLNFELPEGIFDIHICGLCKAEFHDVEVFMQHKKQCPALAKLLASMGKKKKQEGPGMQACQPSQMPREAATFQTSLAHNQFHSTPTQMSSDVQTLSTVVYHPQVLDSDLDSGVAQPHEVTLQVTDSHQTVLNSHDEMVSRELSSIQQHFSCPQSESSQTAFKGGEVTVQFSDLPKGEDGQVLLTQQPSVLGDSSAEENAAGMSKMPETSLNLHPVTTGEFVLSEAQVVTKAQLSPVIHVAQPGRAAHSGVAQASSPRSSQSYQRGKLPPTHHTIVVQHNRARQSEQATLLHAVNETIAEADLEIHSRQLMLSTSKERPKVVLKEGQVKREGEIMAYQFDPTLDKYILDQSHDLSHTTVSTTTVVHLAQEGLAVQASSAGMALGSSSDGDHNISLPVSEPLSVTETQVFVPPCEAGEESVLVQEGCEELVEPQLERSLMELAEDPVFEQDCSIMAESERTLHQHLASPADKRRRQTLSDSGMSLPSLSAPSPSKQPARNQQELQQQQQEQLQSKWRHRLSEMAAQLNTVPASDSGLPKEIVVTTATLQDLAAEASELAESLPDNLASSHLIPGHSTNTVAVNQVSPITSVTGISPVQPNLIVTVTQSTPPAPPRSGKRRLAPKPPPADSGQTDKKAAGVAGDKKSTSTLTASSTNPASSLSSSGIQRRIFKCTDCSYETSYIKDLHRHQRTHTGERPFICPHCNKNFNRSDKLRVHIRWHTGDKPFKCKLCDYASVDSSSLKKHIRTHTDERPFKCQVCPYASRNSSQLIVHLRTHTGDSPFECKVCHSKFKINSDLKRHMRVHTGEKPYQCDICNYKCSIKGNLKSHYRINHCPEKQLQCDSCSFSSSSQKLLREHRKQHADESRAVHACPECKYICSTSSTLKNHLRTHSDEKPFHCDFCSYSAKQRGNVKSHMKKRHADKLRSSRRHGRAKGSGTSKRSAAGDIGRSALKVEERRHEVGSSSSGAGGAVGSGSGGSRSVRATCKKPFQCHLCRATFVKEHSLRCHMRHHATDSSPHGVAVLSQVPGAPALTGGSEVMYKVDNLQPSSSLYIQLEPGPQVSGSRGKPSGYAILAPQDLGPVNPRVQWSQGQKSRGLDQIVDAAARLYEEQYDVQTQTSDSQEDSSATLLGVSEAPNVQQVQVVQVPMELASVQYPSGAQSYVTQTDVHMSEPLTTLNADGSRDSVEEEFNPPVFFENVVLPDGMQAFSSDEGMGSLGVGGSVGMGGSVQLQPVSSSYVVSSKSPQKVYATTSSSSSPSKLLTYLSPKPKAAAPQVTLMASVPSEPHPIQQHQPSSSSLVTYLTPMSSAPILPEQLTADLVQHPHPQQQVFTNVAGQQVTLVQQVDSKDLKLMSGPMALSHVSSPAFSFTPGVATVAGGTSQTSPASSASASFPRRSSRSRPRAIKPLVDLMPATPLTALPLSGSLVSGITTLASSSFATAVTSCNQNLGGLTTVHLSGAGMGANKPQPVSLRQPGSLQYQIQSLLPQPPHQQPVQQLIVQSQPQPHPQQYVLQDQPQTIQLQQGDLPINLQVIQQDSLHQQQQQPSAQTIPINIITPVIQPQPPPPPPPPQQAQPTQIQIILPQSSFPPSQPVALNPSLGSNPQPQRQIILQVQDPGPPPPPAPPPPPPPPPAVSQETPPVQAVMQGGRVVSLPPSVLQSILDQLQGGAGGVSLSGGDGDGQVVGESAVHIQEVVIHMDPTQLGQGLVLKKEDGS